jgi:hypothetical protein
MVDGQVKPDVEEGLIDPHLHLRGLHHNALESESNIVMQSCPHCLVIRLLQNQPGCAPAGDSHLTC